MEGKCAGPRRWGRPLTLSSIAAGVLLLAACSAGAGAAHPAAQATAASDATRTALAARTSATPRTNLPPNRAVGGTPAAQSAVVAARTGTGGKYAGLEPQLDAQQLYALLQKAKLPVSDGVAVTAASDPDGQLGKPGGYTSREDFLDTSLAQSGTAWSLAQGGTIEVFASETDARKALKALASADATNPGEHDYRSKTVILRLAMTLSADQQSAYGLAVKRAVQNDLKRQYKAASVPSPTPAP